MMSDDVEIHVCPSDSESLFTHIERDLAGLTQVPEDQLCAALPAAKKKPSKKRAVPPKAASGPTPAKAAAAQDTFDLREAVTSLQQTVASLVTMQAASSRHSDVATAVASEEGEIFDEPGSFVPERGEINMNNKPAPETGSSLCDGEIDTLLHSLESKNDDLLTEIATLVEGDDKTGPPVNEQLAGTINALASGKIMPEKLEEKLKKYAKPKNCSSLGLTKVNPEIWAFLKTPTRARDVKFQRIQGYITNALITITLATDQLLNARSKSNDSIDSTQLIKLLVDAVAFLGAGNAQLNVRRRDLIRPDLSPKYAPLCSSQIKSTSLLFGDDLVQACKSIQETNKLGSKVYGFDQRGRRRGGNARAYSSHYGQGDFRGYRGRSQQRSPYYRRGRSNFRTQFGQPPQASPSLGQLTSSGANAKKPQV